MSDTEKSKTPDRDALDKLLEQNPKADGSQIREAQELIRELRRDGITRPSYDIASPYERGPVRAPETRTALRHPGRVGAS